MMQEHVLMCLRKNRKKTVAIYTRCGRFIRACGTLNGQCCFTCLAAFLFRFAADGESDHKCCAALGIGFMSEGAAVVFDNGAANG